MAGSQESLRVRRLQDSPPYGDVGTMHIQVLKADRTVENASTTLPTFDHEFDDWLDYDEEVFEHLQLLESQQESQLQKSPENIFKRHRKRLHVTDIASLEWCSLQTYKLWSKDAGKIQETLAVKEGKDVHLKLEQEVYGTERIHVKMMSREDYAAMKLWNGILALDVLSETNVAREIPVYGVFEGMFLVGEVDQISIAGDELCLEDTKTRQFGLPGKVTRGETVQVSVYKVMWDKLVMGQISADVYLEKTKLNGNAVLCEDWQLALQIFRAQTWTFESILELYFSRFLFFPIVAKLRITYMCKSAKSSLPVEFDEEACLAKIRRAMYFYSGIIEPVGVPEEEAQLKCSRCQYTDSCEWRISKAREAATRGMQKAFTW